MKKFFSSFACICLVVPCCAVTAEAAEQFVLGVGFHAGQGKIDANRAFSLLDAGGFNSFRDEVYWGRVESAPGKWSIPSNTLEVDKLVRDGMQHGQKPLVVLGYGNKLYNGGDRPSTDQSRAAFSRYCAFIASNYSGKVGFYEVWNEWSGGMGSKAVPKAKGPADAYVQLSRPCASELKKNDPSAKILVGATAGYDASWTDAAIAEGILSGADGFSVHPYVFSHFADRSPEKSITFLRALEEKLENAGKSMHEVPKPIYVTEMGWPTNDGRYGVTEQEAANYLMRFLFLLRTVPLVKGVWLYEMVDSGDNAADKEDRFGLARRNFSFKPALSQIKAVSTAIRTGTLRAYSGESGDGRWVQLSLPDGRDVSALWSAGWMAEKFRVKLGKGSSPQVLTGDAKLVSGQNVVKLDGTPLVLLHDGGQIHIEVAK